MLAMKCYLVGLDLRSDTHDYAPMHEALSAMKARQVSRRMWLCVTSQYRRESLTSVYDSLAEDDQMMVVEVTKNMPLPEALSMAA